MKKLVRDNSLSIVLGFFFIAILVGHSVAGYQDYIGEQEEHGKPAISYSRYVCSAHFLESVMENWESEFLQMFVFVILTAFLYQKGSADSKKLNEEGPVARDPDRYRRKKNTPWPVRKGGVVLRLYEHSLSLAFLLLFLISFALHAVGGAAQYNEEQVNHGQTDLVSPLEYIGTARFWFESFQNWQSEFLAVAAMVILSIFLRQKGSPESKPVDSPHSHTGK